MLDGESEGTAVVESSVAVAETPVAESGASVESQPVTSSPEAEGKPVEQAVETSPSEPAPTPELASPVPQPKPWAPRVYGADLPIPGATLEPDGSVRIAADHLGKAVSFLADPKVLRDREVGYRNEIHRLTGLTNPQNQPEVIRSNNILNAMIAAFDADQTGDKLFEFCQQFRQNLPLYEAQAKAEAAERKLKLQSEALAPIQQQQQFAAMEPVFRRDLDGTLDQILGDPVNAGIDREALAAALWVDRADLFRPATPEEKQAHGADWTIDPKLFDRTLRAHRYFATKQKEAAARHQKTQTAQQVLAPPKPPPAVSTKGSPTPQAVKTYDPQTPEDWEREFRQSLKAR